MPEMLYFAYGSNMSTVRMKHRIPSAAVIATGSLAGHRLLFHKVGRLDGSGKCDAFSTGSSSDVLHGVIYAIDPAHKTLLDTIEGLGMGYEERHVEVRGSTDRKISAFTYCATNIDAALQPFHWYKAHVLHGAREHNLPEEYIALLKSIPSIDDPHAHRTKEERALYEV